jgi:hypoxanthine-guanine phosphoribosyltransferase
MPDPAAAWAFLEESHPVCSPREVEQAVVRLAAEITTRLSGAYPLVLAVFDCGMDARGFWRNLPEIRAVKGT